MLAGPKTATDVHPRRGLTAGGLLASEQLGIAERALELACDPP